LEIGAEEAPDLNSNVHRPISPINREDQIDQIKV
jgi:hypothetical protein